MRTEIAEVFKRDFGEFSYENSNMRTVKYKRMTAEENALLFKLYEEKMELCKIA